MYLPVCHYKIVTNNYQINNGTTSGVTDAVIKNSSIIIKQQTSKYLMERNFDSIPNP